MGRQRFLLKRRENVIFSNKIDLPYCLVVFFVVCPRLRPFWRVTCSELGPPVKKLSEKLRATTHGYSQGQICLSGEAFLESFWLQASPVEGQSLKQKQKKRRKRKRKTKNNSKNSNFDFCACPSPNVVKRDASGKKGKLFCCKCLLDQIKANLAEIQPENHQTVQKNAFW